MALFNFVQVKTLADGSASTVTATVTMSAASTAGDVFAIGYYYGTHTVTAVSDNLSTAFSALVGPGQAGFPCGYFLGRIGTSGTSTITFTASGTTTGIRCIAVAEYTAPKN